MSKKIVLDACIFIKSFIAEEDSDKAFKLIQKSADDNTTILIPSIAIAEVFSNLQRAKVDLYLANEFFEEQRGVNLKVIEIDEKLILQTIKLIERTSNPKSGYPSFYDAIYHALAILNNCTFITSDKKHYEKTKHEGFIELL